MTLLPQSIRTHFEKQSQACAMLGSPFTATLCALLPDALDAMGGPVAEQVAAWPETVRADAVALRLCGALNMLARSGAPIAAQYPPAKLSPKGLRVAVERALIDHADELIAGIASAPQTNEVSRSGILMGGLFEIQRRTGLPLTLLEIGSSAGLNLFPDLYGYDFGQGRRWNPASLVQITTEWRGAAPDIPDRLDVQARAGSDIAPIDVSDGAARDRMLAYIWPDQPRRLANARTAMTIAANRSEKIEHAGAAAWLETRLAQQAKAVTRVVMHSIMWQYMPHAEQVAAEASIRAAGARATVEAPLAWVRVEADASNGSAAVTLTMWPTGQDEALGRADFHGRWVDWAG